MRLAAPVLLAALAACAPDPVEDLEALRAAIVQGDFAEVEERVHPDYSDVLGDKARLVSDLQALGRSYPRIELAFSEVETVRGEDAAMEVDVIGRQEVRLVGSPEWKLIGPLGAEYRRAGHLRLRSGLLDDLRDVIELMSARRSALEANDAEAYVALLHPSYRDGDLDRAGAAERIRRDIEGVRIRHEPIHYRVELRGPQAHVDERYVLTVGEQRFPRSVARLTLSRSAGRWRIAGGLYREDAGVH